MGLTIGGLSLGGRRRRWLVGMLLGLVAGLILLQPACGSSSTVATTNGGTSAGIYIITISGAAGTGASHNTQVQLQVI
jgi:ammonia channel protein AmtB